MDGVLVLIVGVALIVLIIGVVLWVVMSRAAEQKE